VYEVLKALIMKNTMFWVVTLCILKTTRPLGEDLASIFSTEKLSQAWIYFACYLVVLDLIADAEDCGDVFF
jgi:hypothetical protein